MRIIEALLLGLGFVLLMVMALAFSGGFSPARGQTVTDMPACAPLEQRLTELWEKYGEVVLFQGTANDGSPMIVTVNPAGTSWSAMTVDGAATACLRIVGPSWRPGAAPPPAGMEG
jgi:hypothetical protein